MESKGEVHSDDGSDGSYELVNLDDYGSEPDDLNMGAVVSSSMDLSDSSSYDLLCSEVSDTLVLTEDEAFHTITDEEMKFLSSESAKGDMEFKSETNSDTAEGELGFKSAGDHVHLKGDMETKGETDSDATAEEGDMGFDSETSSGSKYKPVAHRVNKGKKRNLMTMLHESSDFALSEFPDQIKLKDDIKEVAKNHIIRYLPAKSLFKCRKVSKEWNKWISNPFFAHTQSNYFRKTSGFFQNSAAQSTISFISLEKSAYGVPYPSLSFIPDRIFIKCSCNGLLLCQSTNYDEEFYICNPANKQYIKLPTSSTYHGENPKIVLAFEPSSLNFEPCYQVICLFSIPYPDMGPVVHFDIYDSNTKSWMESDLICPDMDASDLKSGGISVNGVVYWETRGGELLACDFKNGIYSLQKLPVGEGGALSNIHGEVCYVRAEYDFSVKLCRVDVYGNAGLSLKNTIYVSVDDVEEGEFVDCTVLGNSCDDVIGLVVKASQGQKRLYTYHVGEEKVEGPGFFIHSEKLFPYVNSLVSINGA
ncbi:hypothetical protein SSX86_019180 [Deinandra increscens subsp. villosa]|uniref:F-box domain-containing protein n=1 Tax=Deinandra increscens subsp. villosa TaxID=3103831 RepID=A0AAP0GU90_9ASTR